MSEKLKNLIVDSKLLKQDEKDFLVSRIGTFNPIEALRLEKSLITGTVATIRSQIEELKEKNVPNKQEKEEDKVLSISVLTQTSYLGGSIPRAIKEEGVPPLQSLLTFTHPSQLSQISPKHVTFGINDSSEQIIRIFLEKSEKVFGKIKDIQVRRNYFMNFLQSTLFSNYLNTGLTALRHPEIEPAKIVLNILHQINPAYLNNNQFQYAAIICNHVRSICAV